MNEILALYEKIKQKHGKPKEQWLLWCKRKKTNQERERVIIESILTQRTNWKNVELAVANLQKYNLCSLKGIYKTEKEKLFTLIKPAGFYRLKTFYLKNLAKFIIKNYQNIEKLKKEDTKLLREKLLKLKGIGEETADSILLYALDKPIFVIDAYTVRILKKEGLVNKFSYQSLQNLFQNSLPKDFKLYQDFHALIVIEGKSNKNKF